MHYPPKQRKVGKAEALIQRCFKDRILERNMHDGNDKTNDLVEALHLQLTHHYKYQ